MNIPSFDDKGNINMYEVLQAYPKDYETFGVNVINLLQEFQLKLAAADPNIYISTPKALLSTITFTCMKQKTLACGKVNSLFCTVSTIHSTDY